MDWTNIVSRVAPFVVKLETPHSHGTGFLLSLTTDPELYVIATARHVIDHASKWESPVRVYPYQQDKSSIYRSGEYATLFNPQLRDLAVLLIPKASIEFESDPPNILPSDRFLPPGYNVGWLGYPFPTEFGLNFFSGRISGSTSTFGKPDHQYLVDGVAINGVSGGPLVIVGDNHEIQIAGLITAYFSNRATGEVLPGLAIAEDSSSLRDAIKSAENIKLYANPETAPQKSMFNLE